MSGGEWRTLLGFGALVLVVNQFDSKAAMLLVGLVGVVTVMRHATGIAQLFGGTGPRG